MIGKDEKTRIAVLASGKGSNFEMLVKHFQNHPYITVALLICNKPEAGVLNIAKKYGISALIKTEWSAEKVEELLIDLETRKIHYLILAGFLKKVPFKLIEHFPGRIINLHPALLPKFGGKGMYGSNVHEAVIASKDKVSGITIHFVDEHYDTGDIIFQSHCTVEDSDTAETLAQKIHLLEHEHFPSVVESVIVSQNRG